MTAVNLTERQREILTLIQRSIAQTGAPPTRAEIAQTLGFRSANAAEDHLQALARKGVIELRTGTSRGIRITPAAAAHLGESIEASPSFGDTIGLPLVGRVAAGSPLLAQEHIDQTFFVQSSLFERKPDYLLKVRGMSMRDVGILDGDLLAVQSTHSARNGQIVVARIGDEVTVKRFFRKSDVIELHPENPDYEPILVRPGESFEVEGLAVGLIRNTAFL